MTLPTFGIEKIFDLPYRQEYFKIMQYPEDAAAAPHQLINRFLMLLEKHYAQHSEVSFYAGKLHITARYLNLLCRKASGQTAGAYIRDRTHNVIISERGALRCQQ